MKLVQGCVAKVQTSSNSLHNDLIYEKKKPPWKFCISSRSSFVEKSISLLKARFTYYRLTAFAYDHKAIHYLVTIMETGKIISPLSAFLTFNGRV